MYVCRHQTSLSYPAIAKAFNREDHTTVMHAVGKIDELIMRDRQAASQVIELTARLEGVNQTQTTHTDPTVWPSGG
jgi:chromosomal replication initiator protein